MTRGEELERLQFRAIREKNDSLLESLFPPDYTYESNLVPTKLKGRGEEKIMWETLGEEIKASPAISWLVGSGGEGTSTNTRNFS